MNTVTFDTHQAVKEITNSGLNDTQAEVIVSTINDAMNQNFATKSDITAMKVDMGIVKTDIVALKTDVGALKVDMGAVKTDIVALKTDVGALKVDMGVVKTDIVALKTDVGALKVDVGILKADMLVLKWMVGLVIVAEIMPLLKTLFA